MTTRAPRFELVRGPNRKWTARYIASNGANVFSTTGQGYSRRKDALRAIELLVGAPVYESPFQDHLEIERADCYLEIRELDERSGGAR